MWHSQNAIGSASVIARLGRSHRYKALSMRPQTLLTITATLSTAARLLTHAAYPCTYTSPLLTHSHNLRLLHTCPMAEQPTPEWLQDHLAELLAAPHIHFTQPKLPGLRLRMGPGPVDVFSTRFMNMFTQDAKGTVNGHHVGRDELKENLLKLQKKYNRDSLHCAPQSPEEGEQVCGFVSRLFALLR